MRALNVVAGLALAAALVGCSDDGTDKADEPTTEATSSQAPPTSTASTDAGLTDSATDSVTPEKAVEAAYRTYVEAFLTGDGATAYGLLSKRCQSENKLSEFAAAAEAAAELYGLVDYKINSVKVDGDTAVLDAEYPVEALNHGGGSEWLLEDGQWRSDKC